MTKPAELVALVANIEETLRLAKEATRVGTKSATSVAKVELDKILAKKRQSAVAVTKEKAQAALAAKKRKTGVVLVEVGTELAIKDK